MSDNGASDLQQKIHWIPSDAVLAMDIAGLLDGGEEQEIRNKAILSAMKIMAPDVTSVTYPLKLYELDEDIAESIQNAVDEMEDKWEEVPTMQPVHDYLGWSAEEYEAWSEDGDTLPRAPKGMETAIEILVLSNRMAQSDGTNRNNGPKE